MIEILKEEDYLEAFFDLEKENGFMDCAESLVETLGLDETNELNLIIGKIMEVEREGMKTVKVDLLAKI